MALLQKRPIILRSLLSIAIPYHSPPSPLPNTHTHRHTHTHTQRHVPTHTHPHIHIASFCRCFSCCFWRKSLCASCWRIRLAYPLLCHIKFARAHLYTHTYIHTHIHTHTHTHTHKHTHKHANTHTCMLPTLHEEGHTCCALKLPQRLLPSRSSYGRPKNMQPIYKQHPSPLHAVRARSLHAYDNFYTVFDRVWVDARDSNCVHMWPWKLVDLNAPDNHLGVDIWVSTSVLCTCCMFFIPFIVLTAGCKYFQLFPPRVSVNVKCVRVRESCISRSIKWRTHDLKVLNSIQACDLETYVCKIMIFDTTIISCGDDKSNFKICMFVWYHCDSNSDPTWLAEVAPNALLFLPFV